MSRPFCCPNRTSHQAKQPARARCWPALHIKGPELDSAALSAPANTKETNPPPPETTMPNKTRGVGLFTAENIVALIRAIPESDGTYRDIARKAEQYGGNVQYHTIAGWISHGRADVAAGQPSTANYARFTKLYRKRWSPSTADQTPTGAKNWTRHSRS